MPESGKLEKGHHYVAVVKINVETNRGLRLKVLNYNIGAHTRVDGFSLFFIASHRLVLNWSQFKAKLYWSFLFQFQDKYLRNNKVVIKMFSYISHSLSAFLMYNTHFCFVGIVKFITYLIS